MKTDWEKPEGKTWQTYRATIEGTSGFARNGAPLAFTWLGWCALLALIRFVEIKTGLWPLTAVKWILGILLWGYFMDFVSPSNPDWLPKKHLLSKRTFAKMLLSFSATAGMVAASYWFAEAFMRHPL